MIDDRSCKTRPFAAACIVAAMAAMVASAPASAGDFHEHNFKFAYVVPRETPAGQGVERLAELASQKTGGLMKIKGFSDGTLGGEVAAISAAQGGILEMTFVASSVLAGLQKEFALYDLPFLFNDDREADAVLDGPVGRGLLDKLADKKLEGLCYWDIGFRQLSNRKHPIRTVDDFKGLKIRTIQNPVFIDMFNALGALGTPMSYSELYSALDSRAVDGQESPYTNHYYSKFYEVQTYVTDSRLTYGAGAIVVGRKAWESLTADEQQVLRDSCVEAGALQRKLSRETNARLLDELKAKGMQFNAVTPENRRAMRDKVAPVLAKYEQSIGLDLMQQVNTQLQGLRNTAK